MKNTIKILTIVATLFMSFQAFSQQKESKIFVEGKYAKLTNIDLQIVVDGNIINEGNLLVLDNKKASLVFSDKITNLPISKIYVNSSKSYSDGMDLITVDIEYFSFKKNEWVSESKSSILNTAGREGSLSVYSDLKEIKLLITANPRDNEILLTDSALQNLNTCSSQQKSSNCCTADCKDGSGNTMECCGAISCSACGTSCKNTAGSIGGE